MNTFKKLIFILVSLAPLSLFAFHSAGGGGGGLRELILEIGSLIRLLIPIVVALALLYFFWGLAKFVLASGNEVDKQKGKDIMLWGIVAIFVMVSVWGIILLLQETLGIYGGSAPLIDNLIPKLSK